MLRWALAVGRTPTELLAAVTSEDVTEMMAFERLEPFGALHMEAMFGRVCSATVNLHVPRDREPTAPSDFMPSLRRMVEGYPDLFPPPPPTADELSASLDRLLFGATVH